MKKIWQIALSVALCALWGCMRESDITYPDTPSGNVDALWHIIDEKYCFVEEKGLDWTGVKEEYMRKAEELEVTDYRGLFNLMADMLDTLKDGHVNLYSSFDISRSKGWYEGYPSNYNGSLIGNYIGSDYKIAGGLYYNKMVGRPEIGYIRYSSFENGFSAANMWYVLEYMKDCKGLIVDVRQNGGGSLTYAYKLASTFMKETTHVGYWQHKTGKGHQDMSEPEEILVDSADMPYKWTKQVVVLCNRQSYSATNTFVSCMRYSPNCTIIGGKTGGGGGMPMSYELPNGWMVRLSTVRMMDRDLVSIEEGIDPDVEVTLESDDKDDIIEKAVKIILLNGTK